MASRRRPRAPGRPGSNSLSQFGLFDVPGDLDNMGGSDGDSDLEAELAALSGSNKAAKSKTKPKPKLIPEKDLNNLIAESMRDIPSDEEVSDGEDDPDLLNELSELAIDDDDASPSNDEPRKSGHSTPPESVSSPNTDEIVTLLQERIEMYTSAEQNAKSAGDSTRARRFTRGLKTLKDQLKQAKAGKIPPDEDIPPPVTTAKQPKSIEPSQPTTPPAVLTPVRPAPRKPEVPVEQIVDDSVDETASLSQESLKILNVLNERKMQYKVAALAAKKSGDNVSALSYMKVTKQFDLVITAVKSGQPVDLSNMPGPPDNKPTTITPILPPRENERTQRSTDIPEGNEGEIAEETPAALITASSAGEALQQRLDLYKQQMSAATEAGNSSKARRMGRIVKQYEQAVKLHAAGKPIPFDELPTPPGYAPIPGAPAPAPEEPAVSSPVQPQPIPAQPKPSPQSPANSDDKPGKLANTGRSNSVRKMGNQVGTGHAERQLNTLLLRQKQFKEAALNAKKTGDLVEAKEFLKCAKGLDPLIDASRGGLPVDLSTVPLPPQAKQELEDSYDIVNADDCDETEDGLGDVLSRLEEQLTNQLKLCMSTRDHHKALGDVAGANRFEHLALSVKQDMDIVKLAKRQGGNPPKFHYETKQFSVVQSCTDLGDNDLELSIVRGVNYNVSNPKDVDTYVKFEFPYPQEEPVKDKTSLIKNTNNPQYNATFTVPINRAQRPCLRVFKRQTIKLEVFSRGCCGQACSCPLPFFSGLFARDSIIGTVNIKLQPLETQTVLHDSFDLMDGRKAVGGKLEVKVRVRHPLLTKQVEQITQKWLIIDH